MFKKSGKLVLAVLSMMVLLSVSVMADEVEVTTPLYLEDVVLRAIEEEVVLDHEIDLNEYTFDEGQMTYEVYVEADLEEINVLPVLAEDFSGTVTFENEEGTVTFTIEEGAITSGLVESLEVGVNQFSVHVVSYGEDGMDAVEASEPNDVSVDYDFTIIRGAVLESLEVYISEEAMEATSLIPEFESNIYGYNVFVPLEANVSLEAALPDLDFLEDLEDPFTYELVVSFNEEVIEPVDGEYPLYTLVEGEEEDTYVSNLSYGSNPVEVALVKVVEEETVEVRTIVNDYVVDFKVTPVKDFVLTETMNATEGAYSDVELSNDFSADVLNYYADLSYGVESVALALELLEGVGAEAVTFTMTYLEDETVVDYTTTPNELTPGAHLYEVTVTLTETIEEETVETDFVYALVLDVPGGIESISLWDEDNQLFGEDFDPVVFDYEVTVPTKVESLLLDVGLVDALTDDETGDNLVAVSVEQFGEEVTLNEDGFYPITVTAGFSEVTVNIGGEDFIYTLTLQQPILLETLELVPSPEVVDFEFDWNPNKNAYKVDLPLSTSTLAVTPALSAEDLLMIQDNELEVEILVNDVVAESGETSLVDLEEGKNTIEVTVTFDEMVLTQYTLMVEVEDEDDDDKGNPNAYKGEFGFAGRFGETLENRFVFSHEFYDNLVQAFKYGSNKNNKIYMTLGDEESILIPYASYLYMVQHKVSLMLDVDGEVHEIDLKAYRIRNKIKGDKEAYNILISLDPGDEEDPFSLSLQWADDDSDDDGLEDEAEESPSAKTNPGKGNKK